MIYFYNLSVILAFLITKSYTFVINHCNTRCFDPLLKKNRFSLRNTIPDDEPFIFTQSSEPGKENEIILCDRETHGINKIISDIHRRNQGNDPIYPVGSFVYVKRGRCSRGTVLFNKPSEIGKPYDVLVALDCRNSEGLLKDDLKMDHGTGHWLSENDLSDDEIYSKNTPPPLTYDWVPNFKYGLVKTSRIYNSKIIDNIKYDQIVSVYKSAVETGNADHFTPIITLIQIARSFREFRLECQYSHEPESIEKARSFKRIISEMVDIDFLNKLTDKIIESIEKNDISIIHYSWLLWSIAKIHYFDVRVKKFKYLSNIISKKITFKDLKTLSQPCLCNILLYYTRFKQVDYKHIFNMAKIVSWIPKEEVNPLVINLLLRVFYLANLNPGDFLNYVSEYILAYHYKIPKCQAIYLLRSAQDFKLFPQKAIDKLYSIAFSYEGDLRDGTFDSSNFYNLLKASIRDKEMFAIFEKGAYASEIVLEPYIILRSMYVLSFSTYNKMKIWIVDKALANIDAFSDRELTSLIYNCSCIDNIPKELIKRIYKHYKERMFPKMDNVGAYFIFRFMNRHPYGNVSDVIEILEALNKGGFRYHFSTIYSILMNLEPLVKRYEIDLYKQFPKMLEDMLCHIRKDASYDLRTFGLTIYFISEMCKELFDKAAKVAMDYNNKKIIDYTKIDKTVLNLAQYIYSIFDRVYGKYDDYSQLQIVKFINKNEKENNNNKEDKTEQEEYDKEPMKIKVIDKIKYFDKDFILQWSFLYLYLCIKAGFINQTNFPRNKVIQFIKPRREYLTNLDLKMIKESIMMLGTKDMELYNLLTSVPKGVNVIDEKIKAKKDKKVGKKVRR